MYTPQEVMEYVQEEDVKFIRLAFCDIFGNQKNISIMPSELERAFKHGISIDASAIKGFGAEVKSDLFLHPDPSTLSVLPWRPSHGRVVRMFCNIKHPDGAQFEKDSRYILKKAVEYGKEKGYSFRFSSEYEFYLFKTDEEGNPTNIPFDNAGYMDISPEDKGENVRREICLTLEDMNIRPESSHHEEGPGQNEIDFQYSDPLTAADNATTFKNVVKTAATRNGLFASFMPKPLKQESGNGMHINVSVADKDDETNMHFMAGILNHIEEITAFLNPTVQSYERLGEKKAPKYITWSYENRSQLIRIPAAKEEYKRIELRSADPMANPYIAYALIIYSGLDGILNKTPFSSPADFNLYVADSKKTREFRRLPENFEEAIKIASESEFIKGILPNEVCSIYKKFSY